MFVAVFIHSAAVYTTYDVARTSNLDRHFFFDWLNLGLNLFAASPTFMVVGGFFAVFLLQRYSISYYLRNRMLRLGAPLVSTALTFGLLETYLRYRTAHAGEPLLSFVDYLSSEYFFSDLAGGRWMHQTWFLVVLIIGVLVTTLLYAAFRRLSLDMSAHWNRLDNLCDRVAHPALLWAPVILGLTVLQFAAAGGVSLIVDAPHSAFHIGPIGFVSWNTVAIYSVYFVYGIILFNCPKFFAAISAWSWSLFIFAMLAFAFGVFVHPIYAHAGGLEGHIDFLIYLSFRWGTSLMFLQVMHRFFSHRPSPTMQVLTDAAMTVYLVHHVLVFLIGDALAAVQWPPILEVLIIFLFASFASLFFHYTVIARFSWLRLFFNGQSKAPRYGLRKLL